MNRTTPWSHSWTTEIPLPTHRRCGTFFPQGSQPCGGGIKGGGDEHCGRRPRYALRTLGFENGSVFAARVMIANNEGHTFVNVLHYDSNNHGDPQVNSGQSLADRLRDALTPVLATFIRASWSVQPIVVSEAKDPQNPLNPRSQWVSGVATSGTRSSGADELPWQNCFLCTLRTPHIGKRFRGRMFLPWPLQEGDQADGNIIAGSITAAETYLAAIPRVPDVAGPGSLATCTWGVYSRTQREQNADPYINAVTSHTIHPEVHVLRSRQAF